MGLVRFFLDLEVSRESRGIGVIVYLFYFVSLEVMRLGILLGFRVRCFGGRRDGDL